MSKSAFSVLLGSSVLAQAILIVASVLFARLYPPDAFGTLAQVVAVASIVTIVAGLRFDHMAFSRNPDQKATYFGAAFAIMLLITATLLVAVAVVIWHDRQAGIDWMWIVLFTAANGCYYLCSQWQLAAGEYLAFGRVRMIQAVLQLAIGVALYAALPAHGMVVAALASQAAVAMLVAAGASMRRIVVWRRATLDCVRANCRAASVNSLSTLLQYATPFAPMIIGPLFFTNSEVGAYFLFASAVAAPWAVLRRAILGYFNGEMGAPGRLGPMLTTVAVRYRGWLGPALLAACAALAAVHANAGWVVRLVFGPAWEGYAALLAPLLAFFALDTLLQPFSTFLGMWGRERSQVLVELLRFALTFAAWPALVAVAGLGFVEAVLAYLALMLAVYVLNAVVVLRLARQPAGLALG